MKITDKMLSIPPYLSTSWKNIVSLQVESRSIGAVLIVELHSGTKIEIPNLETAVLEKVFLMHASFVEKEERAASVVPFSPLNLEGIAPMMTASFGHDPEQKDCPPLPPQMLGRVVAMLRDLLANDTSQLKEPEEGCFCPHCQVTSALLGRDASLPEEEVSDEDLQFRSWDVHHEGEFLYSVTNALDPKEKYHVFLGSPLGCSCGKEKCVHIEAVLKTPC